MRVVNKEKVSKIFFIEGIVLSIKIWTVYFDARIFLEINADIILVFDPIYTT